MPSYLVAVVASQLLSPILWDHYAMLLLLPVAWLLDRGALVGGRDPPRDERAPASGPSRPVVYPLAFAVTLAALFIVPARRGR